MFSEHPLREEVCGQLYRAAEAGTDHRRAYTSVQTADTPGLVNLARTIDCVAVTVLCADGQEGRVTLETSLDKKERGTRGCPDDARRRTAEHVDAEILLGTIVQKEGRKAVAHGLVEAQPTPI